MPALDKVIWDTLFFLFSGKSYAIFALLFGLTFYIQSDNQQRQGKDFRARFAWRLILLLGFGIVNSAFYQGDILTTYALIGFALIPVVHLSSRAILIIASVLMFQPYEWYNVVNGLQNLQIKKNLIKIINIDKHYDENTSISFEGDNTDLDPTEEEHQNIG